MTVGIVLSFDGGQLPPEAVRYLERFDGDLYRAIHGATETVAGWTGHELDSSFFDLLKVPVGQLRIRSPVNGYEHLQQVLRVIKGENPDAEVNMGDGANMEILWPKES